MITNNLCNSAYRYFIDVSYKGQRYAGSQRQLNAPSIEACLQDALRTLTRKQVLITSASRTDAGVHARANVWHIDFPQAISSPSDFAYHLNAILPADIAVRAVRAVRAEAHARFSATSRLYRYTIINCKNPFLGDYAWHYPFTLHEQTLTALCDILRGQHDFSAFSKKHTQTHTNDCTIMRAEWVRKDAHTMVFYVSANRFLRGMVRALVATMLRVARGALAREKFLEYLRTCVSASANFSAPAKGLSLMRVQYPKNIFLGSENDLL